jgi:hypothetical protein
MATIETKPESLSLTDVRSRGRATPVPQPNLEYQPNHGAYGYGNPYIHQPPMYPPYHPHSFQYPPPIQPTQPAPPMKPMQPIQAPIPTQAPVPTAKYPDVVPWFRFLDGHPDRNGDEIEFAPYGPLLKSRGFRRISQLTLEYFKLQDLQEWLEIDAGTAVLIMQYAAQDIEAFKCGQLNIPMDNVN